LGGDRQFSQKKPHQIYNVINEVRL